MSEASKKLVREHQKRLNLRASDEAVSRMADVMDELCGNILDGAEKIREYSKKAEIDREGIEVAAYMDSRLKEIRFKK